MQEKRYFLTQLSYITGIEIFLYSNDELLELGIKEKVNPLKKSHELCQQLINQSKQQNLPVLYEDKHHVLWLCICTEDSSILLGPLTLNRLDAIELHHYYQEYKLDLSIKENIPELSLKRIIALLQLLTFELCHYELIEHEFLQVNHIAAIIEEHSKQELPRFQIAEDVEEKYHHTYQEERKLLDYVREGRVEDALKYNMDLDMGTGRLSKKEVNHWKKVVIVAVTLCTRAAIEGGISPSTVYQLSDFYIQKCDSYDTIAALIACRNKAVKDLTELVRRKKEGRKSSNYVEQCKDYVSKNYKEKIYLEEIADALGLSSPYLSRLFRRETGMPLQEFINWFRVERAANLLMYSEESIAHIAEYVNFPTQSYFGKMFKKYKKITPSKFRNQYKSTEFALQNRTK